MSPRWPAAATVVVLLGLGGCRGDGDTRPGAGTRPDATAGSSSAARGSTTEVAIVSATAAGGEVSTTATRLSGDADPTQLLPGVTSARLRDRVARVAARTDVPAGSALYAAVVAVGCDVPPGVDITVDATGVRVVARAVASPRPECFAPVTSVAVVLAPAPA